MMITEPTFEVEKVTNRTDYNCNNREIVADVMEQIEAIGDMALHRTGSNIRYFYRNDRPITRTG